MIRLIEANIALIASLINYVLVKDSITSLLTYLTLTGLSLIISFLKGSLTEDKTWVIILSSTIYFGLTVMIPNALSLFIALLTLLTLLTLTSKAGFRILNKAMLVNSTALLSIGLVGVVLGVPYISWVVLSPYIEATFLEGVEGGDVRAVLTCLYYVALYAVSLKLSVVLIAYSLTFFFVRFYVVKLRSWSYGWVDSLLRLALWGAVSQWTPA